MIKSFVGIPHQIRFVTVDLSLLRRTFLKHTVKIFYLYSCFYVRVSLFAYSKACINGYSQKDRKLVFKTSYRLMQVKVLQNTPRGSKVLQHSAILLTFIKIPFVINVFLSIFDWPFYTGINRLFAYCKGGNFNIHIWALFGYFICYTREIRLYLLFGEALISCLGRTKRACISLKSSAYTH